MKQGTQSWCSVATQRDGVGREVGAKAALVSVMASWSKQHLKINLLPNLRNGNRLDTVVVTTV